MPNLLADNQPTRRSAPPRPPRAAPPRPQPRKPSRVISGIGAALLAAVIGLLIVEALVLVVWMAERRSSAPLTDALRTGGAFWLLGHGARLNVAAGTAGLIPLGLSAIFAALAARAGASVSRVKASKSRISGILVAAFAVAVPYGLFAALVARAASSGGLTVSPLTAGLGAFLVALFGAAIGAGRELPMAVPKPTRWRALMAGVAVSGGVLVAGAALLAGIALVLHIHDAAALAKPARAGAVGGIGLLALQASLAPNVITWSASYLLGPGFAVGAGTLVSPGHTHLGDVPGLPMLAALPSSAAPWPLYLLFIIPVAAGVFGGLTVVRRLPRTPKLAGSGLLGAAVGAALALLTAAAAVLSGGPVTAGRLATVGPAGLPVGLMTLLEIGLPSAVAAVALTWRREQLARLESPDADDVSRAHRLTDWRRLLHGIRQAPSAAGHGIAAAATRVVQLPGQGVHWLFHGSSTRAHGSAAEVSPEPGRVSLIKAPHDPYELFRELPTEEGDSGEPEADDLEHVDEVDRDEPGEAVDESDACEDLVDVSDEALETDPEDESALPSEDDEAERSGGRWTDRRPHLPKRLRRKPKVIKLPD